MCSNWHVLFHPLVNPIEGHPLLPVAWISLGSSRPCLSVGEEQYLAERILIYIIIVYHSMDTDVCLDPKRNNINPPLLA